LTRRSANSLVLGFLHVARPTADSFRAGYLLVDDYGRPLEFHYSSEVRVSGVQQALYGPRFMETLYVDVLGKPLTDRQTAAPRALFVDSPHLLSLRDAIPAPVVWSASIQDGAAPSQGDSPDSRPMEAKSASVFAKIRALAPAGFDWKEPFERIRLALAELDAAAAGR
jgi:hypothetical protein